MSPIASDNNRTTGASPAPPPSGGLLPTVYDAGFTKYVPMPGFVRIDLTVKGGDAYLQITEWIEKNHFDPPVGSEMLLAEGTHSIPLVRPAFGWRVRSASTTAGVTVDARTFG